MSEKNMSNNQTDKEITRASQRFTFIRLLLVMLLSVLGLTWLLDPGLSLLLIFAVLPVIIIRWWVQQQHLQAMEKCSVRYTQFMKRF
jgi:hypothetical protein